jgi:hypothetical protein
MKQRRHTPEQVVRKLREAWRIRHVHQDQPPDDRVKRSPARHVVDVTR